jgi:type III restriction enzyme
MNLRKVWTPANAIERIKVLNPLCKLRYSATHQEIKNLLFRLSPFDAYRQGLVKKIEVLSVAEKNDEASLKIEISKTEASPAKSPKVRLKLWKETKDKFEWKETPFLRDKDNLYQISGNVSYQNYTIERIYKSPADKKFHVKFTNGVEIVEGERSADFAGLFRQQLHWTIRRHFEKKEVLLTKGIKCLSLIFIDRVDNYVKKDGLIKKLFEEEYTKVYTSVKGHEPSKEHIEAIQGYYFSKNTQQDYTDNEGLMKKNKEIFARILKEKEKLLSLNDPIEFIFSHSALGVGWDNPNVFNIATLNQTYSENKKRQEIGRGLRICVNQQGQRVYDPDEIKEGDEINLLTVIPNETYETFVTQYQSQISEVYGTTAAGAVTRHNHKGQKKQAEETGKLDKIFEGSMFEDFWKKISRKTDYQVAFDEARLINSAVDALNQISIPEYEVQMVRQRILSVDAHTIASEYQGSETASLKAYYSPVDMIEEIGEKTSLSYTSIVAIFNRLTNITEVIRNPHRFINEAVKLITHLELEQIAENTTYHCNGDVYDVDLLKANARTYSPSWNSDDSVNSENEMVYYLKLPDFYKIKVPLPDNSYHLDCGVVIRKQSSTNSNQDMYYFVLEAKGSHEGKSVPPINDLEKYKIRFAQKHFEALGLHTGMPIK